MRSGSYGIQAGGLIYYNTESYGYTKISGYAYNYIGGIAGICISEIQNCINSGKITSNTRSYAEGSAVSNRGYCESVAYVGGIVGSGNSITNCSNQENINANFSESHFQMAVGYAIGYLGGIAGTASTISNCYNIGNIDYYNENLISYAQSAENTCRIGGIAGEAANLSDCYWNIDSIQNPNDAALDDSSKIGTGKGNGTAASKITSEMQLSDFVTQLNGAQDEEYWISDTIPQVNKGYPILKFQLDNMLLQPIEVISVENIFYYLTDIDIENIKIFKVGSGENMFYEITANLNAILPDTVMTIVSYNSENKLQKIHFKRANSIIQNKLTATNIPQEFFQGNFKIMIWSDNMTPCIIPITGMF